MNKKQPNQFHMFTPPTTIGTPNQPHLQSFIVQLLELEVQRWTKANHSNSPCSVYKHIALPTDHICQVRHCPHTEQTDSVSVIKGAHRSRFSNQGSTPFHQYHPNMRKIFTWTSRSTTLETLCTWVHPEAGESYNYVTLPRQSLTNNWHIVAPRQD
jgi:hypothetical protein